MLTSSEIEKYTRDGYVTPDFRLSDETLADIRDAHDRLLQRHPEFHDYCPALLAFDTSFLNVARDPEILDMVSQVIGEDIALWNSSFFAKPAQTGTKTPWHQDGEYWPIRPLATCSVWIAIDPSTTTNGCLRVIPGSHQRRELAQHTPTQDPGLSLPLELLASEFDESTAHDITLEPGQISLHDIYLFHGSEANTSDKSRRGMTLRYMPTSSHYDHQLGAQMTVVSDEKRLAMTQRTLYLMRGIDRSGKNDFRMRF